MGKTIKVRRGLDLPITGRPRQVVADGPRIRRAALLGEDYIGMKPTMEVNVGDSVRRGQLLFTDKKTEGVRYTSPACGRVAEINRGEKRRFLSIVIEIDGDDSVGFNSHSAADLAGLTDPAIREQLVESGLWTLFRTRPFSKVPAPASSPASLFITAMDTHPLAPDPVVVIEERAEDWKNGLAVLARLDVPTIHLCTGTRRVPGGDERRITQATFEGPHPAGLPGTHIHFLDPVHRDKVAWTIGYQDVIAIGEHFRTGRYPVDRIVAVGGPSVTEPRLVRTVVGASVEDLTRDRLEPGNHRTITGSVLGGRTAEGVTAYLGRYHNQVSVLPEGDEREFLGWQGPGFDKFSITKIFASAGMPGRRFDMTTSTGGSKRSMVPIGMYETVMPLDILPTFLLRALITGDTDEAQKLGALELDEEDLALCTFVCPGKYEYGPMLRENLTLIEKEG